MTIATSNRFSIRYVAETVLGETPVTPAFQTIRTTGESINASITTVSSQEIRSDRQTADLILTDIENGGDTNFEMSATTYDDFLEALLMDTWGVTLAVTNTDISVVTGDFVAATDDWVAAGVTVGDWIKVSGFTDPANNGVFFVTAVTTTNITVDPNKATLVDEIAGPTAIFSGSTLVNGITERSYTVEKEFADATVPEFLYFRGMRVSSMSLNMAVGEILTGAFSFIGSTSESTQTRFTGSSTLPATTTGVMDAVNSVATIVATAGVTPLRFNSLTLTYDNQHRQLKAIGTLGSIDSRAGTINSTGTFTPYFEDSGAYNAFLNNTSFDIYFEIEDTLGNGYVFHLRNVKFTEGTLQAGGLDEDTILDSGFQLILDPATGSTLSITRF